MRIVSRTGPPNFSKRIVAFLLINGTAWTWCSYLLAWAGREEIAEALSKTVVAEVLGVVLVYSLKALFENLSKNNRWPDGPKSGAGRPVADLEKEDSHDSDPD